MTPANAPPDVLVVAAWEPTPSLQEKRGNSHRMRLFMNALRDVGARVTIAHFCPPDVVATRSHDQAYISLQSEYWGLPVSVRLLARGGARRETFANHYLAGAVSPAHQPQMHSFAGEAQARALGAVLDERPWDLVLVNRLSSMLALRRSGRHPAGALLFDLDDMDHKVRGRAALLPPRRPGKLAYLAHVPALLAAELRGARASRLTFVCSEADRRHLARLGGGERIVAVPNALPAPAAAPPVPDEPTLLLLGPVEHPPNLAAAKRLSTRILPLVRREVPGARALIAGAGSERLAGRWGDTPGVEFLGFVPDLNALYARTRVVCCPLDTGGGTRLKLVEAAGHARAMVSTRVGAEGLDFVPESEILLREDDEAIAAACVRLLRDREACRRLGDAARGRARDAYDSARVSARLAGLMREVLAEARARSAR